MKTLTIVVGNSNNYTCDSILSGISEMVESGFGFMGLDSYKVLFKWLRYPNRHMDINLTNLPINLINGTVISVTTDDQYDLDNANVPTSGSLTEKAAKSKKQWTKKKISNIKEIIHNIKDVPHNIKDFKDRLDNEEKR
jgi:hypothetical protein